MPVFLISFDLDRIGSNYTSLRKKLVGLNALQAQGSVWFARHDGSADDLRNHLQECLDHNDRLFVGMINEDWSAVNMGAPSRWLREQVVAPGD
ncbi:MAG: hypothetical protein KJ947_21830 [Alphaproteobacteria bacterium]|jgi:hypothetical protein|nr:hypothetical protein [Alphaproteobacteria bacterium]MBU1552186.1 hypothetical protein [Alphaproteobacteria bacterium]MBU2336904.1 hypothetical protein [Alphaproteobacteria bacterium]MBU2389661.1 hypothetical protein [Alphaproteobacteria bacterium]